jgi:heme exporter protein C
MVNRFANPARFMRLSARLLPWCAWPCLLVLAGGLYLALVVGPPDYQQGEAVRIMYVHVPAAWMALSIYLFVAVASGTALVARHPLAEIAARAAAPIGASFTLVCLVSGSLWGRPMWGTWWVWDARLTSVLVLFFLYLGYIALVNAFDDPLRGSKAGSVLALVGVVNLPIIKFSVVWWNTLHQPASVMRLGGPAIALPMLLPLLVMALGFALLFATLLLLRMRTGLIERKALTIRLNGGPLRSPVAGGARAMPAPFGAAAELDWGGRQ